MALDLIPGNFWNISPFRVPSLLTEDDDWTVSSPSGISISEDDKRVYVSTALPGLDEKDIEVTFDKGTLWVKGESREEDTSKQKKYYRKATSSFSYRIAVPGDLDANAEPEASYKNGVMTVSFTKSPTSQPKKIAVKVSK